MNEVRQTEHTWSVNLPLFLINPLGFYYEKIVYKLILNHRESYEPRNEKTCFRGLRQGKIQTGLLSYRDQLESWKFGFRKYSYIIICKLMKCRKNIDEITCISLKVLFSLIITRSSDKYQKCYFTSEKYQLLDDFRFFYKFLLYYQCLTSELQKRVTSVLFVNRNIKCWYAFSQLEQME